MRCISIAHATMGNNPGRHNTTTAGTNRIYLSVASLEVPDSERLVLRAGMTQEAPKQPNVV